MIEGTGAVILAAGVSSISKTDMLKQELDTLRQSGVSPIVVVTGHDELIVRKELVHRKVLFVENPDYKTTKMFRSIQLGLKKLKNQCSSALIVNADSPSFSAETIRALFGSEKDLLFPMHDGKPGHPFSISMKKLDDVLSYDGDRGIQGMMKKGLIKAALIEVNDPGIHMEANEEEDLIRIMEYQKDIILSESIRPEITLSLSRTEGFFGEELAALLSEIDECRSMNAACKKLNMAYSRGWKMIKKAEEMLGCRLIQKQTGGTRGGGSALTEEGRKHLNNYENIRRRIVDFAEKTVGRIYGRK